MTRLLRTILITHKLHLHYPKCIFRPLLSHYSATADSSEADLTPKPTNETATTGWSRYGNIYAHPVVQQSDHRDGDENPSGLRGNDAAAVKKKGKVKAQWVCSDCGHTTGRWWGTCPECDVTGTMQEFHESKLTDKSRGGLAITEDAVGSWLPRRPEELRLVKLEEVNRGFNHDKWRIPLSGSLGNEISTVLGGGLVPGSLTLVGGDPGIGKSTLLLQISAMIANEHSDDETPRVVYVSGEESLKQICARADRLGIKSNIYLYSSTDIEDILRKTHGLSPCALVVDSIQTVYLNTVIGSAGGITQVKECTAALMRFAKTTNISVILIGHVTKSGEIAGPRVLEHIVDVVLYMEGEKHSPYRMLRAVKNRFGSTDELAVLEMSQSGLQVVSNASEMFLTQQLSDSNVLAGLAIAVIMDGTRTFLVEIQALCLTHSPVSSSQSNGIHANKANIIKCVLIKQAGLHLQDNAVFLNVVGGFQVTETAGDLAIAAAICSSFLEFPIPEGTAFIGEIGLGGELRMVPRIDKRVNTVAKLGYKMCVVPKQAEKLLETEGLEEMKVVGCKDLKEVINTVFSRVIVN
ncbi:DNA repair protein RadA-like [Vigna umbellata]|uniref:DNA repair protein RadA-like n=1 Tax=Vigna umbellata TaxID=87088 RepID=UPI001F5F66F1|nr:DNA repair protein RadA-like [Vigna umbellata]